MEAITQRAASAHVGVETRVNRRALKERETSGSLECARGSVVLRHKYEKREPGQHKKQFYLVFSCIDDDV